MSVVANPAARIADCRSCMLCWNGRGPVTHTGRPGNIMVLGESPTYTDDRMRRITHNGAPSDLLRESLRRNGILLSSLFYANVVSCWTDNRAPKVNQIAACNGNLKAQVQYCDPQVILALGAVPLQVTSDRRKPKRTVTKDHGQPFMPKAGVFMDRWVFPIWHPAALAKNVGAETQFHVDIAGFAKFYDTMTKNGWQNPDG